jgi:polyisoprenoid-binding protein YceI
MVGVEGKAMRKGAKQACCILVPWALLAAAAAAPQVAEYRVVTNESELRILVFRAGALGALGHNHVVSSQAISGTVRVGDTPRSSALELSLPLDSLAVDEPKVRSAAGSAFEGQVDDADRRGTRVNMLGSALLDAERYPEVRVVSESISGEFPNITLHARIDIKGSPHEVDLPLSVAFHGDRLIAVGRAEISHSELGLSPFTAGLGTLRVAEHMIFRYRVIGEKTMDHPLSR